MSERKVFAGAKLRRFRQEQGLTQAAMARELGVSASYLTLMERDQRPISAAMLLRLAEKFQMDFARFARGAEPQMVAALGEAVRDPLLEGLGVDASDVRDLAERQPRFAEAIVTLYRALGTGGGGASRTDGGTTREQDADVFALRVADQAWRQLSRDPHVFDAPLARLSDLTRAPVRDLETLRRVLEKFFDVTIMLMPAAVMGATLHRYDPHDRRLLLHEMLPPQTALFAGLRQLSLLAAGDWLTSTASQTEATGHRAARYLRRLLASGLAAAYQMPASMLEGVTTPALSAEARRFGVGVHHLALRLATLGQMGVRPGQIGVCLRQRHGPVLRTEGSLPVLLVREGLAGAGLGDVQEGTTERADAQGNVWQIDMYRLDALLPPHGLARDLLVMRRRPSAVVEHRPKTVISPGYQAVSGITARADERRWRLEENTLQLF